MMDIEEKLNQDYMFGVILYQKTYKIYLMPIAWWIINYEKYDPSILQNLERQQEFRNGNLKLEEENTESFLMSLEDDEIDFETIQNFVEENNVKIDLIFLIDIDAKVYIHNFYDVALEDYIPDDWTGKFEPPIHYLPEQFNQVAKPD